jgi:Tfp pilus assembly protein PilO
MRENLRRILLFIALGLAFLKFGYTNFKEKLNLQKNLYENLKQAYFQKIIQLEDLKAKTSKEPFQKSVTPPEEEILKILYSKEKDPFLLQLNLSREIKELAQRKNLKLEGLDLLAFPSGYKRITEIPLSLRVKGKTKDVLEFSMDLERLLQKKEKLYYFSEYSLSYYRDELTLNLKLSFFKSEVL